MVGEWQTTTLQEFCSKPNGGIQTGPFGSQLHRADYEDAGVPVIMPTNIQGGRLLKEGIARISEAKAEELKRHRVRLGDIIFSRRGEVDKCAVVTENEVDWLCGTGCLLARVDPKRADPRYLGYHISLPETRIWLQQNAVGLVMPNLNTGILERIPIRAPSRSEQEKIADVLASLDAKIDLNCQMASTLEEMAQTLFKSWFADFDPVHAKVEGRDTGLNNDISILFPAGFGPDGTPEGWGFSAPTAVFDIVGGGTPDTKNANFWGGSIGWYSIADAPKSGVFAIGTEKSITPAGLDASPARIAKAGTTIISARGTVGKLAILGRDMAFNQSCYGLVPKDGFGRGFVYLQAKYIVERLQSMAHGAVFSTITRDTFSNLSLPIPPDGSPIVAVFEDLIKPLFDEMLRLAEQNSMLRDFRDAILPKLLSGELLVSDAENVIVAA